MPMVHPHARINRARTESQIRMAFAPLLAAFAKKHFPEVGEAALKDLNDGVADYVANSFETYIEDYEAEMLDEVAYQKSLLKEAVLEGNMDNMIDGVSIEDL